MLPMTELTDKQRTILEAMRSAGDTWIDRAELAGALGRDRLNPHDVEMLERLEADGLIETDKRKTGITEKLVYRLRVQ